METYNAVLTTLRKIFYEIRKVLAQWRKKSFLKNPEKNCSKWVFHCIMFLKVENLGKMIKNCFEKNIFAFKKAFFPKCEGAK